MSQLLTLFITPVLYLYMDRLGTGVTRLVLSLRRGRLPAARGEGEAGRHQPAE